jgi:hypothetical protein
MNQQSNNDASNLARFGPDVFRRHADVSADGVGMARLDSRIICVNPTPQRLLELPDACELNEHAFYDYCPPAARRASVVAWPSR